MKLRLEILQYLFNIVCVWSLRKYRVGEWMNNNNNDNNDNNNNNDNNYNNNNNNNKIQYQTETQ